MDQINQVEDLLDEAYDCRIHNLNQSIELANTALQVSKELNQPPLVARSLSQLSLYYMIQGENEKSISLGREAIAHYESLNDERGIADVKYSIAGTLYKSDNFNLGLVYLNDCLNTYQKYGDNYNQARVYKSMGSIYEYLGDEKSAISVYQSSIEASRKAQEPCLESNAYNPLSGIYLNQGRVEEALEIIEQAIAMKLETGDTRGLAFALYGRGKIYIRMGKFKQAEQDLTDALKIHQDVGDKLGESMAFQKLGSLYTESGDRQKAKDYLLRSLSVSSKYGISLVKFNTYKLLYRISKEENDLPTALQYLEQYVSLKETSMNTRTSRLIEGFNAINKMKELEREAHNQKEKAGIIEKKNLELDSFFYRVSHDLNNPISQLYGLDFMARQEIDDKRTVRFLDEYLEQINRINNILGDLIQITKMNHYRSEKNSIDFTKLINSCIRSYRFLSNFDKVKFIVNVGDVQYKAEWVLINTIFQNLIENAVKYARLDQEEPFVQVEVSEENSVMVVLVKDNGIGMSDETKCKVFNMFYRAAGEIPGTGLGLYILERAVERLNGTIELESEYQVGSTFIVRLPKMNV